MADQEGLPALYGRALALGGEALRLLQSPEPDGLERVGELVAEREQVALAARELIGAGADPGGCRALLEQVVVQQRALEAALQGVLNGLQDQHAVSQTRQRTVQDMRRLLNPAQRPGRLNERR